nr:MAG TPA: hypothetical protein [Bacteriophage sp.]
MAETFERSKTNWKTNTRIRINRAKGYHATP